MRAQDFIFWPAGTHPAKIHMTAGAVKQCLSKTTPVRLWPVLGSLTLLPAQEKGHVRWTLNERYKPGSLRRLSGLLAYKNFRVITHSSSVSTVNPTQNSRWHFKYSRAVAGKLYAHYEILTSFPDEHFPDVCNVDMAFFYQDSWACISQTVILYNKWNSQQTPLLPRCTL